MQPKTAVAIGAGQTPYNSGVVQMVKITEGDVKESLWTKIREFTEWDDLETDNLTEEERGKLNGILQNHLSDINNPKIKEAVQGGLKKRQESEDELNVEQIKRTLSDLRLQAPSLPSSLYQGSGYRIVNEWAGPDDERLNKIWKDVYRKSEKVYEGEPETIKSDVEKDPVVSLLFNSPAIFLSIIGWKTMSIPSEQSSRIIVRLSLFQGNRFNVHTKFPNGEQDTSIGYSVNNGNYTIRLVHRHRSRKEENVPENFFVGMIKEQAKGVAKLGDEVVYDSDAIRSEDGWGYNVWPKMGFDAIVPEGCLHSMLNDTAPGNSGGVAWLKDFVAQHGKVNFSDMFSVKVAEVYNQLKCLWREHGKTVHVVFNQSRGSKSWDTLKTYASSRTTGGHPPVNNNNQK